jgi:hypothetical protein
MKMGMLCFSVEVHMLVDKIHLEKQVCVSQDIICTSDFFQAMLF